MRSAWYSWPAWLHMAGAALLLSAACGKEFTATDSTGGDAGEGGDAGDSAGGGGSPRPGAGGTEDGGAGGSSEDGGADGLGGSSGNDSSGGLGGTAGTGGTAGRGGGGAGGAGPGGAGVGGAGMAGMGGTANAGVGGAGSGGSEPRPIWERRCTDATCINGARPAARQGANAAFDPARAETIVFGGSLSTGLVSDTWAWNGNAWTQRCTATACASVVPARSGVGLWHDPGRQRLLLYGGFNCVGDSYAWDGESWAPFAPGGSPPSARYSMGVAYDSLRQRSVLFGGICPSTTYQETYELAAVWSPVCTTAPCSSSIPSGRSGVAMAFDEARGVTLLFGGEDGGGVRDDTWSFDGSAWRLLDPEMKPPARTNVRMVYHAARRRLILYGGTNGSSTLGDTWEWNGSNWHQLSNGGPPPRQRPALAYDAARERVVLFSGASDPSSSPSARLDDLWELRFE